MDKENEYSNIKKRRVYYKGILFRRFKVVSDVKLTKEEISNIVFTIRDEKGTCDANVIARDIVKPLQENNDNIKTCSLESRDGKSWLIKINFND